MIKNIFLSIVLLCTLLEEGQSQVPWIIGGSNATQQQFPWIGNLYIGTDHQCGSSLIRPNWVLTAGHCVYDQFTQGLLDTANTMIRFNSISNSGILSPSGGEERKIKKFYPYPSFSLMQFLNGNDIALIELASPIHTITPIALPGIGDTSRLYTTGKSVMVAGWGLADTQNFSGHPDTLQWAVTKIYDRTDCDQLSQSLMMTPLSIDRFCAGYKGGQVATGSASGDSGGPLWVNDGGADTVLGVVSGGFGPTTTSDHPGIFTKVAYFVQWINSIINANTTDVNQVTWSEENIQISNTENSISLSFQHMGTSKVHVVLYNLNGQKVYETAIHNPSYQSYVINSNNLIPGMYMLRIYNAEIGKQYMRKIIKS